MLEKYKNLDHWAHLLKNGQPCFVKVTRPRGLGTKLNFTRDFEKHGLAYDSEWVYRAHSWLFKEKRGVFLNNLRKQYFHSMSRWWMELVNRLSEMPWTQLLPPGDLAYSSMMALGGELGFLEASSKKRW